MTPAQRRRATALIRQTCCNYENGNCVAGRWGHLHLPADHLLFRLLQMVPLGGAAAGQGAGSGDIPQLQREALRRMWGGVRPLLQPGEILRNLRQRQETPQGNGQIGADKSP